MSVNNSAVINHFLAKDRADLRGPDDSLYLRDGVLYSYGPHFPLAKWVGEWVLVVQDKSTPMTNRMRNKLRFAILQQGIKMLPITLSEAKEALGI